MVAKYLDLDNLSWQRQPFVKRWKKSIGYPVVPECNHAQESQTCNFFSFFFFCHICRTMVSWDPEILLPMQPDVTITVMICLVFSSSLNKHYQIFHSRYGGKWVMFIFVCLPCFYMKATVILPERYLFLVMNDLVHLAETICNIAVLSRLFKRKLIVFLIKVLSCCYVYIQFNWCIFSITLYSDNIREEWLGEDF